MYVGNWARFYNLLFSTLLLSSFAMLFPFRAAQAATAPPLQKVYNSTSFYEEDGLASNMVYEMAQATDGVMWFATRHGVSTFDGLRWHTFEDQLITPSTDRVKLLPTPKGGMLLSCVATKSVQLHYFDTKNWHSLPSPIEPGKDEKLFYTRLTSYQYPTESEYHISFTYNNQLYLYQSADSLWQNYPLPSSVDWKHIHALHYHNGAIYIFTNTGLTSFQLKTKKFSLDPIPELKDKFLLNATSSKADDKLYVLGNNFVGCYSQGQYKTLAANLFEADPTYIELASLTVNQAGRLIFNYNSVMFILPENSREAEAFKLNDALSTDIPTDIFEDSEGNTWFSTLRGVHKVNSFRFHIFNKSSGLLSQDISTILPLKSGNILLGGNLGISVLSESTTVSYPTSIHANNVSQNRILDAAESPSGDVFLAANALGLGHLSANGTINWYLHPREHFITSVNFQGDSLFVSTNQGELLYFNKGQFKPVWKKSNLYIRKILALENQLTLLTNEGIFKLTGNKVSWIRGRDQQSENVYSYIRHGGQTYLGTMGGLCELKNDSILAVDRANMQINRPVFALLNDAQNRLWAGTDKGVYLLEEGRFTNFDLNHGLSGKEINRHAFQLMPDGKIWMGTDQGVSVYNPAYDLRPDIIPVICLTNVQTPKKELLDPYKEIRLEHGQNTLEFFFRTKTFHLPTKLELRYRLEGLEEDWVYSPNHLRNSVRFTNLPPGDYRFSVQARYPGDSWSNAAESNTVTILNPFYNEWWFLLLLVAGICSVGYFAHVFITQKENARKLEEAIEDKKAQIQESELRFRAVWEANNTGTLLVNQSGRILMANPAICKLLKATPAKATGQLTGSLLPHPFFSSQNLQKAFKAKNILQDQLSLELFGQECLLQVSIAFVDQVKKEDRLMIISCKDVTRQKQAEANNARLNEELIRHNSTLLRKEDELANYNHELLHQREELEQALRIVEERNYELDQFVYKTSHDLRAPIASALGLVNIIKMDSDKSRWLQYVELIGQSLEKQDKFIRAMLNFSKTTRSENKAEPIGFRELIKQCLQELQYLPGFADISKEIEIKGEQELFYSDRMKLYIILSNILSNSIKYHDSCKDSYLHILISLSGNSADLLIKDNGIGIEEKYIRHIFNMFYRATERSDGSGLGLYIVKQTVEKLEGSIQVNSEAGVGTSFHIQIPNQHAPFGKDFLMDSQNNPSLS